MKLYTFYTPSHRDLFSIFRRALPEDDRIELQILDMPQECPSATYMGKGWQETMHRKVQYVMQALDETPEGEWFVHSDCDVVLFPGWADLILDWPECPHDMMIQNDLRYEILCAGFFFCKSNAVTKKLWRTVYDEMHLYDHDQTALNVILQRTPDINVRVLSPSYFTYGALDRGVWEGEPFKIPDVKNLKMFHANWTKGVENKIWLMKEAIKQYHAQ